MAEDEFAKTKGEFLARAFRGPIRQRGDLGAAKRAAGVPVMSPFHDCDYWYLLKPITWLPDPGEEQIYSPVTVPVGFVTDLASVPSIFWTVLPPAQRYTHAAIVHDYMYWEQSTERPEADEIFRLGMRDLKVPAAKIEIIFRAVRGFGGSAWTSNAKLKTSGEKRVLVKYPEDPLVSWSEWKKKPNAFL